MFDLNTSTMIIIAFVIFGGIFGSYYLFYRQEKKEVQETSKENEAGKQMQLQAYERLAILAERISIPALVNRMSPAGIHAAQYQGLLCDTIRQEYDYNLSQQLYVSPASWQAINNLKEQNIFIVNQISATLPADAPATELAKRILEFLQIDPNASLHPVVLEALRFEAKKLIS